MDIQANERFKHNPIRPKKLLLRRKEINKLNKELVKGLTIVVKKIFFNEKNRIKIEIALAKGKKEYDKRNTIKEREAARELRNI